MDNIQIKGMEVLSEEEKQELNEILKASYEKLKRKTKTDFLFKIVIKVYSKDKENLEKRKKFSIQASISGAVKNFEASADDWVLSKTLHKVVTRLDEEIEHAFHSSEQH